MKLVFVITLVICALNVFMLNVYARPIKKIEPILDNYIRTGKLKDSTEYNRRVLDPKLQEYIVAEKVRKEKEVREKAELLKKK